jgi:hypothetical protein
MAIEFNTEQFRWIRRRRAVIRIHGSVVSTERAGLLTGQGRHQRLLVMALARVVQTSETIAQRPIDDP